MEIVLLAVEGFNQRPGCFDQENRVSALSPWRLCLDHGALGNYAEWGLGWIRNDKRPSTPKSSGSSPAQILPAFENRSDSLKDL